MRHLGWTTIAQDESTSVVWGMPRAAVALDAAAHVLPLPLIGQAIANFFLIQNSSQAQAHLPHSEKMLQLGKTGPVRWAGLLCDHGPTIGVGGAHAVEDHDVSPPGGLE